MTPAGKKIGRHHCVVVVSRTDNSGKIGVVLEGTNGEGGGAYSRISMP